MRSNPQSLLPWMDQVISKPFKTGALLRPFASVTFLNCSMGAHIKPEGWNNWGKATNQKMARYFEYHSRGPGGATDKRVPWSHQLSDAGAEKITLKNVLGGRDH